MTRPFFQPKSSPISRPTKPRRSQSYIPNCASCCSKSSTADTQWKIPVNRSRAPSGPVKTVLSQQPHMRHYAGIEVLTGICPVCVVLRQLDCKIALVFVGSKVSKIPPQVINIACPNRDWEGAQHTAKAHALQAVGFVDKNVARITLGIEDELLDANCFSELLRGYTGGFIFPSHSLVSVKRIVQKLE